MPGIVAIAIDELKKFCTSSSIVSAYARARSAALMPKPESINDNSDE